MAAIDVGADAIDRPNFYNAWESTIIDLDNPANLAGLITNVEIYSLAELSNVKVGLFSDAGGGNYTCRSTATLGTVAAGHTDNAVSLAVQVGDFIAIRATGGNALEVTNLGGVNIMKFIGDAMTVDETNAFAAFGEFRTMSVHGTGAEVSVSRGWMRGLIHSGRRHRFAGRR